MIFSRLKQQYRPSATAALISIFIGLIVALVAGFGSWLLVQNKASNFLALAPTDWLTLTPVVSLVLGSIPLFVSVFIKKTR